MTPGMSFERKLIKAARNFSRRLKKVVFNTISSQRALAAPRSQHNWLSIGRCESYWCSDTPDTYQLRTILARNGVDDLFQLHILDTREQSTD
jgi:hypothetical protein